MSRNIKRLAAAVVAFAALATIPYSASADTPTELSAAVLAGMSPEEQGRVLEPLRVVADGVVTVGRDLRADIYTSAEMSADYKALNVYLTDTSQADAFIAQVHKKYPNADTKLIVVKQGKNSEASMVREASLLLDDKTLPFEVYSASFAGDGGSITLSVNDPGNANSYLVSAKGRNRTAAPTLDVRVEKGAAAKPLTRENDFAPFYAGGALGVGSSPERSFCTSGIPTISTWDNRQWLVTAGHCYDVGAQVYTHGGNYVGQVRAKDPNVDAAFIEAETSDYTWDGYDTNGYMRGLNGARSTVAGDYVCNLGYNTKVMCNIRVAGSNIWPVNGTNIVGSVGGQWDDYYAATGGDSGGPIITINDTNTRQINGTVSTGFRCDNVACKSVGWPSAVAIMNAFSVRLHHR
ncbi:hypothetical protein [Embleya sp. NPDC020630]|uniref:hypothetical protein n=1 Tax=Embleya sp. NPDC020630 TaxID=3363979 RepID=UPI0037A96EC2